MFIASFPAGPWQTNCYLVATEPGAECVVIDPGMGAAHGVSDLVAEHRLKPVAAIVTHGHLDHMFSVTPLCATYETPCWVHPADRALLANPMLGMGPETAEMLSAMTGATVTFREPDRVNEMVDGTRLEVAGLELEAIHAPGHTPGSVMFTHPYPATEGVGLRIDRVVFTGDVLFAGSIGRTDLPGGNHTDMLKSLRTKVRPLPRTAAVLPGHGPQTTMAHELEHNPYLTDADPGQVRKDEVKSPWRPS